MNEKTRSSGNELADEAVVIELSVRELGQLFDSMDPSPFHKKDLDRSAHEYIVSAAKELSSGDLTALKVYLAQPAGLPEEGKIVGDAIRIYFSRRAEYARRDLRHRVRLGWITLVVGLFLLIASVIVGQLVARRMGAGPLATVIRESLLIGGWVAMWRPMDFFLYELWTMRGTLRVLKKLSEIPVRIVYTDSQRHDDHLAEICRPTKTSYRAGVAPRPGARPFATGS